MDNATLLQKLAEKKIIEGHELAKLQQELAYLKQPIDQIIHDRRLASDEAVAQVKAEVLGVPYRALNSKDIPDNILSLIPEETALNYKLLPISHNKEMLVVGMVNPDDEAAQDALRFISQKLQVSLGVYVISIGDFETIAKRYSPYKNEVEAAVKQVGDKYEEEKGGGRAGQRVVQLDEGVAVSEEAPVIKIVSSTLQEAVDQKASDIHIEPQRSKLRIRFRIDGDLKEVAVFPVNLYQPIVSRIKVLAELKIDERRIPQDGRFRTIISGRDIDFRVATFPTPSGEKVVLRILDSTVGLKGLPDLGISEHNMDFVNRGVTRPFGMIIISGPTGSGKTTTLYGILQILNKEEVNIVSLEDPIEYYIDGLNQSQVRPEIGYSFASGLRQILRQDPDIIMVGEIRDSETAELAAHAALTGHIVLTTIHTNNAIAVIPRLLDLGVQKFLLPSALNLVAAQRLLGRLCQKCKKEIDPPAEILQEIERVMADLPEVVSNKYKKPYKVYEAKGCAECKQKGIKGRIALFEIFEMTDEVAKILSKPELEVAEIKNEAKKQGMLTLRQDGILKALAGLVRVEEVIKETKKGSEVIEESIKEPKLPLTKNPNLNK